MEPLYSYALERFPQFKVAERGEERSPWSAHHRNGVCREPDGRCLDRSPWVRVGEGILEHASLTRELPGNDVGVMQHRLLPQPLNVCRVRADRLTELFSGPDLPAAKTCFGPEVTRPRGVELLRIRDLGRLVTMVFGQAVLHHAELGQTLLGHAVAGHSTLVSGLRCLQAQR